MLSFASRYKKTSVAVLLLLSMVSAGCHTNQPGSDSPSSLAQTATVVDSTADIQGKMPILSDELPQKDQQHWVLPTDVYNLVDVFHITSDAEIIHWLSCVRENGYPDFPLWVKPFAPRSESFSPSGNLLFNEDLAAKYGYHLAPDPSRIPGVNRPDRTELPENFTDLEMRCNIEARAAIEGISPEEYQNKLREGPSPDASEAERNAYQQEREKAAQSDPVRLLDRLTIDQNIPSLIQAAQRWRECIAPLGIPDLPERPWSSRHSMPGSLWERFNIETEDVASAEEISMAVADAQCRRESGWADALYEEEWRVREEFMQQHREALRPHLEQIRQKTERAIKILMSHGY